MLRECQLLACASTLRTIEVAGELPQSICAGMGSADTPCARASTCYEVSSSPDFVPGSINHLKSMTYGSPGWTRTHS